MDSAQWLLLDADDTLWENNVFFEEVIAGFIAYVDHATLGPEEVRAELDRVESRNIQLHGYGTENFTRNLIECYEGLRGRPCLDPERESLFALTALLRNHPIELMPGVQETLDTLAERYPLALVTKGPRDEQHRKLERSGLAGRFRHVAFAHEKDIDCYKEVIREIRADPARTWMIGNSPKSDINPALAAGLGAVLILNGNTWSLEMEAVSEPHARFRILERFSDLSGLF